MAKKCRQGKQWHDKLYGNSTTGKSTNLDWYAEFIYGRTDTDDVAHSGWSNEAAVPENI